MTEYWATIRVRASRGENVLGEAPAEVRKAAIDFESVFPRKVKLDDTWTTAKVNQVLEESLRIKVPNCKSDAFLFDGIVPFKTSHTIDPRNPSVWTMTGGTQGGTVYSGETPDGTVAFIGFEA